MFLNRFSQLARSCSSSSHIKKVTVFGGGLMGSGIAQVAATTGHQVNLVDLDEQVLKNSQKRIEGSLEKIIKKKFAADPSQGEDYKKKILERLKYMVDLEKAVEGVDLVVESVVEKMEVKHKLFKTIDKVASDKILFASNTSSFLISDIAKETSREDRFGGLHFFNPVPSMKLLEVIKTDKTSEETFKKLLDFGVAMGKTTVIVRDTYGFVVNRLLLPFLMESLRMSERGDASLKDIDTAIKLGLGHPMGPLELMDFIGLDTCKLIVDGWREKDPNNPLFSSNSTLDKLVSQGNLGKKSGKGLYEYKKK